jgi:glycosyltransferase involved in cell wall biosynthesis
LAFKNDEKACWLRGMEGKLKTVLFVSGLESEGGAAKALVELCSRLVSTRKFRCVVLTAKRNHLNVELEKAGATTIAVGYGAFLVPPPYSAWKAPIKYLLELLRYVCGYKRSMRLAEKNIDFSKVDIIHSNVPRIDIGLALARKHGIKHIYHLRENSFTYFKCWSFRRDPVNYMDRGTDAYIAISQAVANNWIMRGVDKDKVWVIYDGVDTSRSEIARSRPPIMGEKQSAKTVFLGGYIPSKGVWDAVGAIDRLVSTGSVGVTLDIYGGGPIEVKKQIEAFLENHGLTQCVTLHGEVEDVWSVLPHYDIGLTCAENEAFGRTVVEFQASGLITVVSRSGAFPEIVHDGADGFIYESALGAKGLADVLNDLLNGPHDFERITSLARLNAARFSDQMNCEKIVGLYEEIEKSRRAL